MIFKVDGKEIEADFATSAKNGIYLHKYDCTVPIDYIPRGMSREKFKELAEKQLEEHPNYLDIDEIWKVKYFQ